MNILVTGANGQLGNELRLLAASSHAASDRYIFTDIAPMREDQAGVLDFLCAPAPADKQTMILDITDREAVLKAVADNNIGVIVNCAAFTDVEGAEDRAELAEKLNADAAENLAIAARINSALLIHISTDYVFGKEPYNTPCREDQKGTPTGVYGLSKLHGEQKILSSGACSIIIRTAWLYSEFGKNFLKTMLNLTGSKPALKVVFDQTGTPTYALDLARLIVRIIEGGDYESCKGIYHYSNEGVCSWYDFTKLIARCSGHNECRIEPCHSDEFPSRVTRPSYSVLDKTKVKRVFNIEIPYWSDQVCRCTENLLKISETVK
ncbi:MAG: dTDP-4-dehydrorhamnose reductase [Candidatus Cryptobacteroides sp.]